MQRYCNSWRVRNLIVMVLRINESLTLAESIVSLHPHQAAQPQRQLWAVPTVNTPRLVCQRECQRWPLSVAPNHHAERWSPQRAGDLNVSHFTIRNTVRLHARCIWQLAAHPDMLNTPSIVNSMLTMIQSMSWTCFPTSNTLESTNMRSFNHHHHLLCHRWKQTPAPVLPWVISLLSHGNETIRAAFGRTHNTMPSAHVWRMRSTNISIVGGRRWAWRHTMTTCWRRKTLLHVSQASKMGIISWWVWLACQMIRVSGSGNYTLLTLCDGVPNTNALSNTGVETSSEAKRWSMPQAAYAKHHIYTTQHCFKSDTPPKCLYIKMHTAGWWWEAQVRRDTRGWQRGNWH